MTLPITPVPVKIREINGSSKVNESTEIFVNTDPSIPAEGYSLSLDNNRFLITKSTDAGEFYARQSIRQIIFCSNGSCPNFTVEDYPRFGYRSFMIDCCRHFFNVDELKKIIDCAAMFKFNTFHWHLTDDQGWRIPIKNKPELIDISSCRKNSLFGGVNERKEYKFSFTRDEIKEIINYCKERYIEVVPEIEMPGHTTAILAAHPEFGCTGEKIEVAMKEGIYDTVLCPGNKDAVGYMKEILDDVCELFPGKYIHIGGDEAPRKKWQSCPKCNARMKELGITDYNELQGHFIKDISGYLRSKGKTAISWNESLKGGVLSADETIIHRWMEKGSLSNDFAAAGGRIIEADFYHYYCDYPYGMTPVSKTYNYHPVGKKIRNEKAVMGIEAEMWTEYIRSFDDLIKKFYPRSLAIAEAAWSPEKNKNYKEFRNRINALRPLLSQMGIEIIPENEWSLMPLHRLGDIIKFFKGSFSIQAIMNSLNNNK